MGLEAPRQFKSYHPVILLNGEISATDDRFGIRFERARRKTGIGGVSTAERTLSLMTGRAQKVNVFRRSYPSSIPVVTHPDGTQTRTIELRREPINLAFDGYRVEAQLVVTPKGHGLALAIDSMGEVLDHTLRRKTPSRRFRRHLVRSR